MSEYNLERSRKARGDWVYNYIKHLQSKSFNIGDILIRKLSPMFQPPYKGGTDFITEKFSNINDTPRKYEVVAKDDVGIPYIMKLGAKGDKIGDLICLADIDTNWNTFEYDPEFIDHQILADEDEEFDPQETYWEKRIGKRK